MKTSINKYEYIKKWKKENPDKVREQRKVYREKHKDIQRKAVKKWRLEHPNYTKEWRKRNPDKAYKRKYPIDLMYERNKLIYQAKVIQKLSLSKIGEIFRREDGKILSRQRVCQIVVKFQKGLDKQK